MLHVVLFLGVVCERCKRTSVKERPKLLVSVDLSTAAISFLSEMSPQVERVAAASRDGSSGRVGSGVTPSVCSVSHQPAPARS